MNYNKYIHYLYLRAAYHYPHKNPRFYNLHHSTPYGYPFCLYLYAYA